MERIYAFLPSVLVITCIAGVALLYVRWNIKRFGDNFKSVEWQKKNQWVVIWTVGTPLANVWAPAVEELLFRAPLIIMFGAMSSAAWYGIFTSSGLFALLHLLGKKIYIAEILSSREDGDHESDDIEVEMNRLHQEAGTTTILVRKALHVVITFPLGILAGYYGIKYQSIWVAFWIHSAWNLIMPIVLPILATLAMLAFLSFSSLWTKVKWQLRRL